MLVLPGSLLWLFFLVCFACGQNLDNTSLDNNNSNTTQKRLDEIAKTVSLINNKSHEEKKENTTSELLGGSNKKIHLAQNIKQLDFSTNKTSASKAQELMKNLQELNTTVLSGSSVRNSRSRTTKPTSRSNSTEIPIMSQERRNSYLSIAERRKYYNRTRGVQTKKPQFHDFGLQSHETANKLITSSTDTLQVNEIREIKRPLIKESSKGITTETLQTNNQKIIVDFSNNETQEKPQTIRQSVIQSLYQFGQKLNLRKPVSRIPDAQEERFKIRKEKMKIESVDENSTNKLNKNYPTQSTKLIKVDQNHWATTFIPQANTENENFVKHSLENETVHEELVDSKATNHSLVKAFFNKATATLERHDIESEMKNQTKVSETNILNPLPLSSINSDIDSGNYSKNKSSEEKILIRDIYNQEILKLNDMISKTAIASARERLDEISVTNFSDYTGKVNNSKTQSAVEATSSASEVLPIIKTTNFLKVILNTTYRTNFNSFTTPLNVRNGKFSNHETTQPTVSKSDSIKENHEIFNTTIPMVKAKYKESSNLAIKTRFNQSEANILVNLPKHVSLAENKENQESGFFAMEGNEKKNKTEEYPLTIELNENNKRVFSEMFQTLATPKLRTKEEISTSQSKLSNDSSNTSSNASSAINSSAITATTLASNIKTVMAITPITILTTVAAFTYNTSINSITNTTTTTEDLQVLPPDDHQEDHKAQGTRYSTKFYISPKFSGSQVIKVIEEDDDDDDDENDDNDDDDVNIRSRSAGVAIYVLAAFGLIPLLLALVFGTKFIMQRNQRQYECESDAKSDLSANENQFKEVKKKKGSTDLKKSPSNVTTITLVTPTRLPRVQHWDTSEKQGNRNWEFPRSKLKLKTILGQGNFGQVWKAEAEDMPGHEGVTRLVAVKAVKEGATEKEHTEFIKELEIMQQIGSHPNIVTLLGCCTDQEPHYLIMEYVKHGKLLTYLREHRINENYYNFSSDSNALTSRDLTVFAYCVARGMEYLASRGIIHRDLAARNVLVDHNKLCKIADFGMSRSIRDFENGQVYEERQQKGALPIRWMAPESLVYSVFTCKSDVWSFGIVMWEIVTLGSTPYPNMGAREVMRRVRDGYRLERPSHCKPEFYRLISYCWAHDPNKRPDFAELRHELSTLLDNPTKDGSYVDLDRFAIDNSFQVSSKTSDFRLLERNDFKTLQKLGDWNKKDWPEDIKKIRMKKGRNNGKGTVTLTGQGSFTVNSRILEKEFKLI